MCGRVPRFFKVISPELLIPDTTGEQNLWDNDGLLGMGVIENARLEKAGFKNPLVMVPTKATKLCLVKIVGKPTFRDIFAEFGYPMRFYPNLTQGQAVEFARLHRDRVHPVPGVATFMLTHGRVGDEYIPGVVSIYRGDPRFDALGVGYHEFADGNRWLEEPEYQLLIPAPALERRIPAIVFA